MSDSESAAMQEAIKAILRQLATANAGIPENADTLLMARANELRGQGGELLTGIAAQIDKLRGQ